MRVEVVTDSEESLRVYVGEFIVFYMLEKKFLHDL
jgi:hypothetical protein